MTRIFHRQIGHSSPPRRGTGDHLQPAPPFIVDESLIDVIVQRPNDEIDAVGQTQVKS
jgi:hypothetical protein